MWGKAPHRENTLFSRRRTQSLMLGQPGEEKEPSQEQEQTNMITKMPSQSQTGNKFTNWAAAEWQHKCLCATALPCVHMGSLPAQGRGEPQTTPQARLLPWLFDAFSHRAATKQGGASNSKAIQVNTSQNAGLHLVIPWTSG